ncbi:transposase family protein [Pseudomonas aeruginosa]|nr:transposase family protein [Pseudomonas aeruginosa]
MSTQRFTPEFKAEAVRQVIERGYTVAEIAARLGVSTHSLYKWVKAVTPISRRNRPANYSKPRVKSCGCEPRCGVWKKSGTS